MRRQRSGISRLFLLLLAGLACARPEPDPGAIRFQRLSLPDGVLLAMTSDGCALGSEKPEVDSSSTANVLSVFLPGSDLGIRRRSYEKPCEGVVRVTIRAKRGPEGESAIAFLLEPGWRARVLPRDGAALVVDLSRPSLPPAGAIRPPESPAPVAPESLHVVRGEPVRSKPDGTGYAIAPREWANVRERAGTSHARVTQVLLGSVVRITEIHLGWCRVEIPAQENLCGWIRGDLLTAPPDSILEPYLRGPRLIVAVPFIPFTADTIPFGAILPHLPGTFPPVVILPDGRRVALSPDEVVFAEHPASLVEAVDRARALGGIRFQRGGLSRNGVDGGGLVHLVYRLGGKMLPRSGKGLLRSGEAGDADEPVFGDVLIFKTYDGERYDLGISLGDDRILTALPDRGVAVEFLSDYQRKRIAGVRTILREPS